VDINTSFGQTALNSVMIWAAWHMPLVLGAIYHGEGTSLAYSVVCFTLMVLALSFLMAWITLLSGSLWPAALLHAAHNLFVQSIFD
jgi:membrane protease YdiL (CAAX protease family)